MEISSDNQFLSRVEAVVTSMDENLIELQITGSYETFQWPRNLLQTDIKVGEKILLELKKHPVTAIQKVVEKAGSETKDPSLQLKLLESLIN